MFILVVRLGYEKRKKKSMEHMLSLRITVTVKIFKSKKKNSIFIVYESFAYTGFNDWIA